MLRANASVAWVFVFFAALAAFALVRGYLGAATTAGRIGTIIFMGVIICLLAWPAIYMATHRPTMSISADSITYAKATSARTAVPQVLVLDRSSGNDLRVVTAIRRGGKYTGLTIQGSGTILSLQLFDVSAVRRACIAKGWQFPGMAPPKR